MSRSVVVLELNELCPTLLDRFMDSGDLPNFARLRSESVVYTTDADEPQGRLNPWIQWVTAHTGAGFDDHGVFKLGEGSNLRLPTVADVVTDAGGTSWLCGPMNVVPIRPVRGTWLPDPWNPDEAGPAALAPFARFVRANVQEHTNASNRLGVRAHLRFLAFMARHGLSASTVRAVLAQLASERRRGQRWRRAALLDRFQWDLFRHELLKSRPTFATYFSNTTAHYQHLYWRYMDPDPFELKPTEVETAEYGDAVAFGYREMDRLVGDALRLAEDDITLVFCTALSQQPYTIKDAEGGSRFYRPNNIAAFAGMLGLTGIGKVAPVMSAQFHLLFDDEADAAAAEAVLRDARVGERSAFDVRRKGSDVFTGFALTDDLPADAMIDVPGGIRLRVHDVLYRAETAKSGYHHPHGALWMRTPTRIGAVVREPVSLRAVAPTLLDLLDLDVPASMTAPPLPRTAAGAA
ncbi:MAG: hypothetical protein WD691_02325 [Acidimicrobiales bacterium]